MKNWSSNGIQWILMGYAGITNLNVQPHFHSYFHAISIQQVTNYIKTTICQSTTVTGNAIPTANAGLDYTIPKSTPFMLVGIGTDANRRCADVQLRTIRFSKYCGYIKLLLKQRGSIAGRICLPLSPESFLKCHQYYEERQHKPGLKYSEALSSVVRTLNFRLTVRRPCRWIKQTIAMIQLLQ
ncbi:MAG: hypothetical protein IPO23_08905 [Flavobacterium sp.]|nr:hypothetical protein [Flavobacterium sp.]